MKRLACHLERSEPDQHFPVNCHCEPLAEGCGNLPLRAFPALSRHCTCCFPVENSKVFSISAEG